MTIWFPLWGAPNSSVLWYWLRLACLANHNTALPGAGQRVDQMGRPSVLLRTWYLNDFSLSSSTSSKSMDITFPKAFLPIPTLSDPAEYLSLIVATFFSFLCLEFFLSNNSCSFSYSFNSKHVWIYSSRVITPLPSRSKRSNISYGKEPSKKLILITIHAPL